jgi:hypothetical protein
MNTRILTPVATLLLLMALTGCNGQVTHPPQTMQSGTPTPSPGSGFNPVSGTSAQD